MDDLKKIVNYGWSMIYLCNSYGSDVSISDNRFKCFIGKLMKNGLRNFSYYANKLARKIRFMYKRRGIQWDGYYYFALTKKQFEEYLKQTKTARKKNILFKKVFMFRILEECKVSERGKQYIFRIKWPYQSFKYTRYYETLSTKDAELIIVRDPLKMYDLLTSYNKYKYL